MVKGIKYDKEQTTTSNVLTVQEAIVGENGRCFDEALGHSILFCFLADQTFLGMRSST